MERRLIDAGTVIKSIVAEKNAVEKTKRDGTSDEYEIGVHVGLTLAHGMVLNAPVIDAVEVIRCKDCGRKPTCKHTRSLGINGYCSEGERKEAT